MQRLITAEQARQITRGRAPLVPIQYESAVKSLQECITLDDAKIWSDKADALAAWAKMYRNDDVGRKAKQLKLHAYRRMGQLAHEIGKGRAEKKNPQDHIGGPVKTLMKEGFTRNKAETIRRISTLPEEKFQKIIDHPKSPPTPNHLVRVALRPNPDWSQAKSILWRMGADLQKYQPRRLAKSIDAKDAIFARKMSRQLMDWLDDFESNLPATITADKSTGDTK